MTADEIAQCPLCGSDAKVTQLADVDRVACVRCGNYKIVGSLLRMAIAGKDQEKVKHLLRYLSAHTRQASERGEMVTLDTKNWKDFALAHKGTPFSRKVEKLLELLASRSEPGTAAQLEVRNDAPLVDAASETQLAYCLSTWGKQET